MMPAIRPAIAASSWDGRTGCGAARFYMAGLALFVMEPGAEILNGTMAGRRACTWSPFAAGRLAKVRKCTGRAGGFGWFFPPLPHGQSALFGQTEGGMHANSSLRQMRFELMRTADVPHPADPVPHPTDHLSQHPVRHENRCRPAGRAVLPGWGVLGGLLVSRQSQRGRLGGHHCPGGPGRRNRCGHAPVPGTGVCEAARYHLSCAVKRVRPKAMTACEIIAGLAPILWSQGTGATNLHTLNWSFGGWRRCSREGLPKPLPVSCPELTRASRRRLARALPAAKIPA